MKTILFLLIILPLTSLTNAQEKQLPNLEETSDYIESMLEKGITGTYYLKNSSQGDSKGGMVIFLSNLIMYIGPEYTKEYVNSYSGKVGYAKHYVERKRYNDIDFKKLSDVKLISTMDSRATALIVKLIFSDEHIFYDKWILQKTFPVAQEEWESFNVQSFNVYIPYEEGSFERFKRAMFHYKDLLIAEQKQKIADDPFAN